MNEHSAHAGNRTHAQRIEDELEEAWIRGEITHSQACAELEQFND